MRSLVSVLRVAGLATALSAGALPAHAAETAAVPEPQAIAPAISVVPAETREVVERAVITGTLVPRDEILVSPEIEGFRITELLAEEGDRVAAGQVLARLSHGDDRDAGSLERGGHRPVRRPRSYRPRARSFSRRLRRPRRGCPWNVPRR